MKKLILKNVLNSSRGNRFKNSKNLSTKIISKDSYTPMKIFDPEPEILKFYKQYLFDDIKTTKLDYENMHQEKLNYIEKNSHPIGGSQISNLFNSKVTKFLGILEYKIIVNSIVLATLIPLKFPRMHKACMK